MKNRSNQKQQRKMFSFIKAWEKSGLNKKRFCKEHRVPEHLFYYWYRKYRQNNESNTKRFVPVRLNNKESISGSFEVSYPNGVRISLPTEINLSDIKYLIELI